MEYSFTIRTRAPDGRSSASQNAQCSDARTLANERNIAMALRDAIEPASWTVAEPPEFGKRTSPSEEGLHGGECAGVV